MTNHAGRLYALAFTVLLFFVLWAAIAARPWQAKRTAARDPRITALAARERRLRHDAVVVRRVVRRRFAAYEVRLRKRRAAIVRAKRAQAAANAAAAAAAAQAAAAAAAPAPAAAPSVSAAPAPAAPSVRVVTLPPITVTRSS